MPVKRKPRTPRKTPRDPMVDRVAEIVAGKKEGAKTILARKLGLTQAAVSQWKAIPLARAIQIERLTNGKITIQEMRPDLFGKRKGGAE